MLIRLLRLESKNYIARCDPRKKTPVWMPLRCFESSLYWSYKLVRSGGVFGAAAIDRVLDGLRTARPPGLQSEPVHNFVSPDSLLQRYFPRLYADVTDSRGRSESFEIFVPQRVQRAVLSVLCCPAGPLAPLSGRPRRPWAADWRPPA